MTYTYDNGHPPCYDHDGYTDPLLDGTLPEVDDSGTDTIATAIRHGHAVVGWRAACACDWKGSQVHLRADHPVDDKNAHLAPDSISDAPGPIEQEWAQHVRTVVPETRLRDLHIRGVSSAAVAAEVQTLRVRRVPWGKIAAATDTTEQQALSQWGHLDLYERERTGADTRPGRDAFQGPLTELEALAEPNSVHTTPDPAVEAVELAAQGLTGLLAGGTPDMVDEAVWRIERALAYAYRARANLTGGIDEVSVRDRDRAIDESEDGAMVYSVTANTLTSHHHGPQRINVERDPVSDASPRFRVRHDNTTTKVTDPELHQRIDYAYRALTEAVNLAVTPDDDYDPMGAEG